MRRKDREISDPEAILDIAKRCDVINVAFINGNTPYVIPLNFGIEEKDGHITLYFHGHKDGTKTALIAQNPTVAFSMYTSTNYVAADIACMCTMKFESVCGTGVAGVVPDEEKAAAFSVIMKCCFPERDYVMTEKMAAAVLIWKIDVTEWTGKSNLK